MKFQLRELLVQHLFFTYFLMGFFFEFTIGDSCGFGCFSTSLGSNHLRGWRLKKGQFGTVTSVVRTTPPAYMSIIVLKEAVRYPVPNATTANASNIICISFSARFCPCQSIWWRKKLRKKIEQHLAAITIS